MTDQIKKRSDKASQLALEARVYLDQLDRDQFDGHIPYELATEIYRSRVCELAMRHAKEQAEPFVKEVVRALSMLPVINPPLPNEVDKAINQIYDMWAKAAAEVIGE